MNKNSAAGLHLLDLLIALVVLGVVLVLSVPSFSQVLGSSALKRETEQLQLVLESLILTAVGQEKDLELVIKYHSYRASTGEWRALKPGLRITTPQTLRFYKSGVCTPGSIVLSDTKKDCTITLSLRGRVHIFEDNCNA